MVCPPSICSCILNNWEGEQNIFSGSDLPGGPRCWLPLLVVYYSYLNPQTNAGVPHHVVSGMGFILAKRSKGLRIRHEAVGIWRLTESLLGLWLLSEHPMERTIDFLGRRFSDSGVPISSSYLRVPEVVLLRICSLHSWAALFLDGCLGLLAFACPSLSMGRVELRIQNKSFYPA